MKVVVNRRYGGFGLSHEAIMRYAELKGFSIYCYKEKIGVAGEIVKDENKKSIWVKCAEIPKRKWEIIYFTKELKNGEWDNNSHFAHYDLDRSDPVLVQVVEELGEKANGDYSKLEIVDVPNDIQWHISEYDGMEHVAENHRSW